MAIPRSKLESLLREQSATHGEDDTTDEVRAFYERWPFPRRDPEQEQGRLIWTPLDFLTAIGERCFDGHDPLPPRSRILVAGCGTGDSAIWLAEQVRSRESQVVALDLSASSLDVTKARAEIRGLTNMRYEHASILDIPRLGLGRFDYVNCGGVLHHLDDPDAGLIALRQSLAPRGVMGLMVYGRYGRAGVDVVRAILDTLKVRARSPLEAVEVAARVLGSLPETHLFKRMTDLGPNLDARDFLADPGALADMFLHPQERSYTVPEIHAWLGKAGLSWRAWAEERHAYLARAWIRDPAFLAEVEALDAPAQHAVAEQLACTLRKHSFYASPSKEEHRALSIGASTDPADSVRVPLWWIPRPKAEVLDELRTNGRTRFGSRDARMVLDAAEHVIEIVEAIDGKRTISAIVKQVAGNDIRRKAMVRARLYQIIELISLTNELFVRHVDAPHPLTPQMLQRRAIG
jgi:SAM-dependent methyltransferase